MSLANHQNESRKSSKQAFSHFKKQLYGATSSLPPSSTDNIRHDLQASAIAYFRLLRPFRYPLLIISFLACLCNLIVVTAPLAVPVIIDDILPDSSMSMSQKVNLVLGIGTGVGVMVTAAIILSGYLFYKADRVSGLVMLRLRRKFFKHLTSLSLYDLAKLKIGGVTSRIIWDTEPVYDLLNALVMKIFGAVFRILLTVVVLFFLSWQLTLLAAVIITGIFLSTTRIFKRQHLIHIGIYEELARINSRLTEVFSNIRLVKIFGCEPREEFAYVKNVNILLRKIIFGRLNELPLTLAWTLLPVLAGTPIFCAGIIFVIHGHAKLGTIIAYKIYIISLLQPVVELVLSINASQRGLACFKRIQECFELNPDKLDKANAVPAPAVVDELRLEHVCFHYQDGHPVLHDISVNIKAGMTVAIVGPSGAGKSTLTDLLVRFYDPVSGRILINGVDIRDIKLHGYRQLFGLVQQEVTLFDETVRFNIAYGLPKAPLDTIIKAAKQANAHEFIEKLPDGYDTLIGERGHTLSGGQRQRLSIARAYLANPRILILDEATSNLDSESEQLIQEAMKGLLASRTTFIIAHRLSTITHADLILVLDNGRVIETGTHRELLAKNGLYAEMIKRQQYL